MTDGEGEMEKEREREQGNGLNRVALRFLRANRRGEKKKEPNQACAPKILRDRD